jgi:hypothetical protein
MLKVDMIIVKYMKMKLIGNLMENIVIPIVYNIFIKIKKIIIKLIV